MQTLDVAVGLRAARADLGLARAELRDRRREAPLEFVAVVAEHALEPPAGLAQGAGDALSEATGLTPVGSGVLAADQLGPRKARVRVDRGQLPDGPLRAVQPADVKAVDADQLARPAGRDVRLGRGVAWRLVGRAVAGDQAQPLGPRRQPVPAQRLVTPLGETTSPPHSGRASIAAIRRGPRPGWPSENATIRSSTTCASWLGSCGRRRSRGLSISSPWRSTCAFQR